MIAFVLRLAYLSLCVIFGITSTITIIPANAQAASGQTEKATDVSCPYFRLNP
jgi:hypothetical protein